jgi:outer membrane protein assembly factor BamA
VVTVAVNEGESYSLGEVKIDGAGEDLVKAANLKTGDVFNINDVREGADRVMKRLRRDGYMDAKADIRKQLVSKLRTVDVTIAVTRGEQYRFGKLTIQGLDLLTEPHIRGMWAVKSGQPFNADYPEYFLGKLREDAVLDNLGKTESRIAVDEAGRTVDVTLIFRGAAPPPKPERK